jgi:hypothetical protein
MTMSIKALRACNLHPLNNLAPADPRLLLRARCVTDYSTQAIESVKREDDPGQLCQQTLSLTTALLPYSALTRVLILLLLGHREPTKGRITALQHRSADIHQKRWAEVSTLLFVLSYPFSPRWSQGASLCVQAEVATGIISRNLPLPR